MLSTTFGSKIEAVSKARRGRRFDVFTRIPPAGEFSSLSVANDSLTALRKRDSVFISAKVTEINPKRKEVNR
jgi:hypothetical protein